MMKVTVWWDWDGLYVKWVDRTLKGCTTSSKEGEKSINWHIFVQGWAAIVFFSSNPERKERKNRHYFKVEPGRKNFLRYEKLYYNTPSVGMRNYKVTPLLGVWEIILSRPFWRYEKLYYHTPSGDMRNDIITPLLAIWEMILSHPFWRYEKWYYHTPFGDMRNYIITPLLAIWEMIFSHPFWRLAFRNKLLVVIVTRLKIYTVVDWPLFSLR